MEKKYKRRKYLIHHSSQLKYIALTIIPALAMSLYCTYSLMHSGDLVLKAAKKKRFVSCYRIRQSLVTLAEEGYTKNTAAKIAKLNNELNSLKKILETTYVNSLMRWNETKRVIFTVLFGVLIFVGLLSIVYSHRIAGPLFRIRRCVDILAQGKDIPPIRLRKRDEFKELAASLDKLRSTLKDKGLLESE